MRAYPHHLTTDLPQLPVPTLQESLERYRIASAALYDAVTEGQINQTIADFVLGPAPALQDTLEEYADATAATGSNWMAEHWLEQYLRGREPLLLTTNSTYQLNLPTAATGVDRVVELLYRIGSIHVLQARRETPEEYNDRGERVSMDGWATFNGGIRTPTVDEDLWVRAGTGATYRTIGLMFLGRMWEVPLTGSDGKLVTVDQLRSSVEFVLSQTQPAEHNFADISAVGSKFLALAAPWEAEENRSLYTRLANMLFTLTIDPAAEDDPSTLQRWAFEAGNTWVYKPISYLTALNGQLLAATVEHSVLESGTLATAVTRMQELNVDQIETRADEHLDIANELIWQNVQYDLSDYRDQVQAMHVEQITVPRNEQVAYDVSINATAQFILMIAQQLTYGQVRAHRQCCDMRHYRAGRTETIRPVTMEALTFVRNLVQGNATEEHLTAALNAHRDWVQAAKHSTVCDRHMLMLQYIGRELGGADAEIFFKYTKARDDFITTTTASPETIIRAIRPPSTEDGFGVHYTTAPSGIEYVLTWSSNTPKAEAFATNLQSAAELLHEFLAALVPIVPED